MNIKKKIKTIKNYGKIFKEKIFSGRYLGFFFFSNLFFFVSFWCGSAEIFGQNQEVFVDFLRVTVLYFGVYFLISGKKIVDNKKNQTAKTNWKINFALFLFGVLALIFIGILSIDSCACELQNATDRVSRDFGRWIPRKQWQVIGEEGNTDAFYRALYMLKAKHLTTFQDNKEFLDWFTTSVSLKYPRLWEQSLSCYKFCGFEKEYCIYQIFYEMLTFYDQEVSHNRHRTNDTPMLNYEDYIKISAARFDSADYDLG